MIKFAKKIILLLLVVAVAMSSLVMFVGCDRPTITLFVDYQITDQITIGEGVEIGSLLFKPSDPYYTNHVFYTGRGAFSGLNTTDKGLTIENIRIKEGYNADIDYIFMGWYKEPECIRPWVFSEDRIYEDKSTIYAKWIPVTT